MSCRHPVYQWTRIVTTHFPHLSKPQARVLALWSLGMVVARSCALSAASVLLAQWLDRKANTVRQQLREFCYEIPAKRGADRQEVVVETCFVPLLAWVLSWWDGHQLALAVDATTLGQRFVVLALSVLYRGCAIPVAWTILPAGQKHAWRREWLRMLRRVRAAVPRRFFVIVLADRGLYARWLFRRIVRLGWHPLLRVNMGGSFRPAASSQLYPAGTLGRGLYRPLVAPDRSSPQCGRCLLVWATGLDRARLQDYQPGGRAVAAHAHERSPARGPLVVGGGGRHPVAAQCGRGSRENSPGRYVAGAARHPATVPTPTPGHPAALGQCLSPGLAAHPGRAAPPSPLAHRALRARTVAQRRDARSQTRSDSRGASCRIRNLPLKAQRIGHALP